MSCVVSRETEMMALPFYIDLDLDLLPL